MFQMLWRLPKIALSELTSEERILPGLISSSPDRFQIDCDGVFGIFSECAEETRCSG